MKKFLSLVLSIVMVFSIISGMDVSVLAGTSNTTIEMDDTDVKHMVGSSFAVSASYKSDTYSHNNNTISYEISGPKGGLELDGGLSCLGTKEDGIISYPFIATRVGKYVVTIKGPDGAEDSATIFVTNENLASYLADAIKNKNSVMNTSNFCLYKTDMEWTFKDVMYKALGEGFGFELSSTQLVETIIIRVLVEKLTREDIIEREYAETASNITECISGVISLNQNITTDTNVTSLSDAAKNYISDFYGFDVFDTLSSVIDGATTLAKVSQVASFYKTVSEHISAEQLDSMFAPIIVEMYKESYADMFSIALLEEAYISLLSAIENTDIKVANYIAGSAAAYGLNTFKTLVEDVTLSLAANSLNIVCPGLGTALSVGMTVVSLCKAIDSLFTGKLEGVEKSLGVVNFLGELYRKALIHHSDDFVNGNVNSADYVVDSYQFLIASSQVAVDIQSENLSLLQDELLKAIYFKPAIEFHGIFMRVETLANDYNEFLTSYSFITEKYPVMLEYCNKTLSNEREFLRKTIEDYLFYVYGSDVYKYIPDLWEIPVRYTITYSQNYSNDTLENFEELDFVLEGSTLDSQKTPRQRSGYKFTGWFVDSECKRKYNFDTPVMGDVTLYAGWEAEIKYKVKDDKNARVTDVCENTNTYSLNRSGTRKTIFNDVVSQIDVIIPIFMDGYIITEIGQNSVQSSFSSIFIPESIELIESNAIPKSTVIYCEEGTYAEEYANSNGYSCVRANVGSDVAETGKIGALSYKIINGEATITDCEEDYSGSVVIPKKIGCYRVTSIGYGAFRYCESLTSITIPDSITNIDNSAFDNCTSLTSVYIIDIASWCNIDFGYYKSNPLEIADNLYIDGELPTNVVIPDGVTQIPAYTFRNSKSLTSITIPDSVKKMGDCVFYNCTNLEAVYIKDIAAWCNIEFLLGQFNPLNYCDKFYINGVLTTDVVIPDGVTCIEDDVFFGCESLTSITIPDSVTSIGNSAFSDCTSLTSVTIGNSVTNIGVMAFEGCTSLTSITIPGSVTSIGNYAFHDCESLTSITIPDSVTSIGYDAFDGCDSLTSATIGDSVTSISYSAFENCTSLTSVTIGNSVTSIDGCAFRACDSLTSVTIGNSVTSIGHDAFWDCDSLTSIIIPDSVTSIGDYAFYGCDSLASATIGDSVTSIGRCAFYDCPSLKSITILGKVTEIEEAAIGYDHYHGSDEKIADFMIYGYKETAAETYANKNGFTFIEIKEECEHKTTKWITDKKATVYKAGSKHKECTECGETLETAKIAQLKCSKPSLKTVTNTTTGVKFTWNKTTGADNYEIYRKSGSGKWTKIATVKGSVTSYTDTKAKSGTTYKYTVKAKNEAGLSGYNTTGISIRRLITPTKISVSNVKTGVSVKWNKVTGATGYYVMRKTGNGSWVKIATVKGTTYTDKTVKSGVNYKYTIKAYYGNSVSAYNTTGIAIKCLVTPTLKSVTSTKAGVTVKWNKVTGASGYYVLRKTGNGAWKQITNVKGNAKVTCLDKTAKKGTTYKYTVKAYSGKTVSAYNTNGLSIKDKY